MGAQDTITSFLRGKGLTPAQVAGVEGNLAVESGMNPAAYNPGEGAIGIAQWEGGRRTALQAYAHATGGSETDLNTQLGFMWSELTGSNRGALTALTGTTSPAAAAAVFDQQYERSSGTSRQQRIDAANQIAGSGSKSGTWGLLGRLAGAAGWMAATGDPSANDAANSGVADAAGAAGGAAGAVADAVSGGWQTAALGLGVKLLAAGAAAALVIVGAREAFKDQGDNT